MKISEIVEHLRTSFKKYSIGGVADIDFGNDRTRLCLPALLVGAGPDSNEMQSENESFEGTITETLFVLAVLPVEDRSGHKAQDEIHSLKWALLKALHGYPLEREEGTTAANSKYSLMRYNGSQFVRIHSALYFHQFNFEVDAEICFENSFSDDFCNFESFFGTLTESSSEQPLITEAGDILVTEAGTPLITEIGDETVRADLENIYSS